MKEYVLKNDRTIIDTLAVFPNKLVNDINNICKTKKTKGHVYSFIWQLATASQQKYKSTSGRVPFPAERFRLHFGMSYQNWLRHLLNSQIVMKSKYYSKEKKICLDYWINPIYNILENTKSESKLYIPVPIKLSIKKMSKEELKFQTQVTNDFMHLNFDEVKLKAIVKKHIDDFSLKDYLIGEDIIEEKFEVTYTDSKGLIHTKFMSREIALINSKKYAQDLIYNKKNNKCYSCKLDDFILSKKSAIERYYLETIFKLVNKKVYAIRNKTNFRVDSNMTNCPSLLLKQIISDNDLCQIDMSNAQFAIFANNVARKNLMIPNVENLPIGKSKFLEKRESELRNEIEILSKSEDFRKFSYLASTGDLYEEIQQNLGLGSRAKTKQMMFQLLFSSEGFKSDLKDRLIQMFPNVITYIDNYKKCYGYKNFSIELQKRESEIFIDDIYVKLKKANIATITRHDSIIIKLGDEEKVWKILENSFKSINFNCILEREARISDRFYVLAKLHQAQIDKGIKGMIQVTRPAKKDVEDIKISLVDDTNIGSKKTRAPKKSSLNFNR